MRMGPFSEPRVIELLNQYFVPVFTSNEAYRDANDGRQVVPLLEIDRLNRVRSKIREQGMPDVTVSTIVLQPDGTPLGALHVRDASQLKVLLPFLNGFIEQERIQPGDTLVVPRVQSIPPTDVPAGARLFHLTTRTPTDDGRLETTEDWIVVSDVQWRDLAPNRVLQPGEKWEVPRPTAEHILTNFYPYSQNWNTEENDIRQCELRAEVLPRKPNSVATMIALRGGIVMWHARQPTSDLREINSSVVGYISIPDDGSRAALRMVTGQSMYGPRPFAVLVETVEEKSSEVEPEGKDTK